MIGRTCPVIADGLRRKNKLQTGGHEMPGKTYPQPCPDCGGECWDNREGKRNPKAPDAKCKDKSCGGVIWPPKKSDFRKVKDTMDAEHEEMAQREVEAEKPIPSGIDEARKHLMQSANLYNLCVDCVEKAIWPHLVSYSQKEHSDWLTCDLYQAAIATLYIEASRSGCVLKMPDKPIK